MFRKLLDSAKAGDNVGVLLRGTTKEEVERGMVLAKTGQHYSAPELLRAEVYVPFEGRGRSGILLFSPIIARSFISGTTDVTGTVSLPRWSRKW